LLLVFLEDVLRSDVGGADCRFETGGSAEKHCGLSLLLSGRLT
jgi:hypothetical protein